MSVTKKLLEYLKIKGIVQSKLSKDLGIAQSNLHRILNSDDIKVSQLLQICEMLKISPVYFFEESDNILLALKDKYKTEFIELQNEISNLKKQLSIVTFSLEAEKGGTENLFKMFEDLLSNDNQKVEETKVFVKAILKYRNGLIS